MRRATAAVWLGLFVGGCASPCVAPGRGDAPPVGMPSGAESIRLDVNNNQTYSLHAYDHEHHELADIHGSWRKEEDSSIRLDNASGQKIGSASTNASAGTL